MPGNDVAPTFRELSVPGSNPREWGFDPHWLRWFNDLRARPGIVFAAKLAADAATAADINPISLTGLRWDFRANAVYIFRFVGSVSPAAATTGCGFQLATGSAAPAICMAFYHSSAPGVLTGGMSTANDASLAASTGFPGTGNYPVVGEGTLISGAVPGTAQLRFRAEVAGVVTARAGFALVVEKIL